MSRFLRLTAGALEPPSRLLKPKPIPKVPPPDPLRRESACAEPKKERLQ
jgi:hypothetical protein